MIFVTVGGHTPFDRLVRAVDEWARTRGRGDVFAQIGMGSWRPSHISWTHFIAPNDYEDIIEQADLMVAHAGIGSILSAMQHHKPLIVMPRRGQLRETRNDHQLATARQFATRGLIVADDAAALMNWLDRRNQVRPPPPPRDVDPTLYRTIRDFINGASLPMPDTPLTQLVPETTDHCSHTPLA